MRNFQQPQKFTVEGPRDLANDGRQPMKIVPSSSGEAYLALAIASTVLLTEMAVFSLSLVH